jgi:hypothetical protein
MILKFSWDLPKQDLLGFENILGNIDDDCRILGMILRFRWYLPKQDLLGFENIHGFKYGYFQDISKAMKWAYFFKFIYLWICIWLWYINFEKIRKKEEKT